MLKIGEIKEILGKHDIGNIDVHIHTHLCDGLEEMTVENIAKRAIDVGLTCIILTPHFHKQVSDETAVVYTDTNEEIFLKLRDEIEECKLKYGDKLTILLSTEVDIIGENGESAINFSKAAEDALDLVSLTLNYHPMLPLDFVRLTYGRFVDQLHENGDYARMAEAFGGVERVLETMYQVQVNAIEKCPYPALLGHFFMPHSAHPNRNNCFGAKPQHLDIMKEGAKKVIAACKKKDMLIDLTGVHLHNDEKVSEYIERSGFLTDFHKFVIGECMANGLPFCFGSDGHILDGIGSSHSYYRYLVMGS